MSRNFVKDPDAVLDYAYDWSGWLADGEAISSHEVTADEGMSLDISIESGGIVTAWFSGGTVGVTYAAACLIVTDQGRTDERTIYLTVRDR